MRDCRNGRLERSDILVSSDLLWSQCAKCAKFLLLFVGVDSVFVLPWWYLRLILNCGESGSREERIWEQKLLLGILKAINLDELSANGSRWERCESY